MKIRVFDITNQTYCYFDNFEFISRLKLNMLNDDSHTREGQLYTKVAPYMTAGNKTEEYVIEAWTGFKDKDGVDIYEGDILSATSFRQSRYDKYSNTMRIVKRHYYDNQLHLFPTTDSSTPASGLSLNSTTHCLVLVIGNIHDNSSI